MPSVRAAVSLSWIARKARPVGLSIRFTAISAPTMSVTPEIQYQAIGVVCVAQRVVDELLRVGRVEFAVCGDDRH